jgi:hypothetical protein
MSASSGAMLAILHLLGTFVANLFRSRRRLEVEEPNPDHAVMNWQQRA